MPVTFLKFEARDFLENNSIADPFSDTCSENLEKLF